MLTPRTCLDMLQLVVAMRKETVNKDDSISDLGVSTAATSSYWGVMALNTPLAYDSIQ